MSAEESRPRTRVLVVDDQRAFSDALCIAIGLEPDLECVGVAETVAEAVRLAADFEPDVVLMDVQLPGEDGLAGTRRLKELHPDVRVLIITAHANLEALSTAALAGACGFIPKETAFLDVLTMIRAAQEGLMTVDAAILGATIGRLRTHPQQPPDAAPAMTPRELEVLRLMGQALDTRAIAAQLGISIHTCRGYVKSILSKLAVHSQLEAVVQAVRTGLLPDVGG